MRFTGIKEYIIMIMEYITIKTKWITWNTYIGASPIGTVHTHTHIPSHTQTHPTATHKLQFTHHYAKYSLSFP